MPLERVSREVIESLRAAERAYLPFAYFTLPSPPKPRTEYQPEDRVHLIKALVAASVAVVPRAIHTARSFCVRCNRSGKHPFTSLDVQHAVGAALHHRGLKVNLRNPELIIQLHVHGEWCMVMMPLSGEALRAANRKLPYR